jgi:hypothetical protein
MRPEVQRDKGRQGPFGSGHGAPMEHPAASIDRAGAGPSSYLCLSEVEHYRPGSLAAQWKGFYGGLQGAAGCPALRLMPLVCWSELDVFMNRAVYPLFPSFRSLSGNADTATRPSSDTTNAAFMMTTHHPTAVPTSQVSQETTTQEADRSESEQARHHVSSVPSLLKDLLPTYFNSVEGPGAELHDAFSHPLVAAYWHQFFMALDKPQVMSNVTQCILRVDCTDPFTAAFRHAFSTYLFRSNHGRPYDVSHFIVQAINNTVRFDHLLAFVDFAIHAATAMILSTLDLLATCSCS